MHIRSLALVPLTMAVLPTLDACASPPARAPGTSSSCSAEELQPSGDCAGEALERQMAQNRAYRKYVPLPVSATAAAEPAVHRVRAALEPLASTADATEAQLRAALQRLGFRAVDIQTRRLAFGVEAEGGCIDGGVRPGTVTVTFEGYVAGGGCLALDGH